METDGSFIQEKSGFYYSICVAVNRTLEGSVIFFSKHTWLLLRGENLFKRDQEAEVCLTFAGLNYFTVNIQAVLMQYL